MLTKNPNNLVRKKPNKNKNPFPDDENLCTIKISELPKNVNLEQVFRIFKRFGKINGIHLNPLANSGRVIFNKQQQAQEAYKTLHDNCFIFDKQIFLVQDMALENIFAPSLYFTPLPRNLNPQEKQKRINSQNQANHVFQTQIYPKQNFKTEVYTETIQDLILNLNVDSDPKLLGYLKEVSKVDNKEQAINEIEEFKSLASQIATEIALFKILAVDDLIKLLNDQRQLIIFCNEFINGETYQDNCSFATEEEEEEKDIFKEFFYLGNDAKQSKVDEMIIALQTQQSKFLSINDYHVEYYILKGVLQNIISNFDVDSNEKLLDDLKEISRVENKEQAKVKIEDIQSEVETIIDKLIESHKYTIEKVIEFITNKRKLIQFCIETVDQLSKQEENSF